MTQPDEGRIVRNRRTHAERTIVRVSVERGITIYQLNDGSRWTEHQLTAHWALLPEKREGASAEAC